MSKWNEEFDTYLREVVESTMNKVLDARARKSIPVVKPATAKPKPKPVVWIHTTGPVVWKTVAEAAEFFDVSETTIRKWIRDYLMDASFKWQPRGHWTNIKVPASKREKLKKHHLKYALREVPRRVLTFFNTGEIDGSVINISQPPLPADAMSNGFSFIF